MDDVVQAHNVVLQGGAARGDHALDVHVLSHLEAGVGGKGGRRGGREGEGREGGREGGKVVFLSGRTD
jgi:hypothetical protein